jgi:ribose transport system substrate-binding protein
MSPFSTVTRGRRRRRAALRLVVCALLIAACGGTADPGETTAPAGDDTETTVETGTDTTASAPESETTVAGGSTESTMAEGALTAESLGVPSTDDMVDTAAFQTEPPWTIGYADASLSNTWRVFAWQYMQYGASQLPETEIIQANANDSTPKQISDIQDLVARDVDCLIVAATSESALSPVIAEANAEVPVVIMERSVDTEEYTSFASLDAVEMGRLQAQAVVDELGGEGSIVILQGVAGSGPVEQSLEGMQSVLDENPGVEVLATEFTNWSRDEGKTAMENLLQAHDQIDAVLSDSGLQNMGAFEAVEAAGRLDEVQVWSGDSVQEWMRVVSEHELPGIIVDRPTSVGEIAIKTCGAILSGIPVPAVWATPNQVIAPEDIEQYIAEDVPGSGQWWDWWNLPEEWLPEA